MLTNMTIFNVRGDALSLPISDFSGGYLVSDIEGLSPVKATLTSSTMAQVDGAQPQSSRRETRNITMVLKLKPDFQSNTVDSLRSNLYRYLMPKSIIGITFDKDGSIFAQTTGTVESLDNVMFTQDPTMNCSIICYDPDFDSPESVTIDGATVAGSAVQMIDYEGTSDAGIIFTMTANRNITGFTIYNTHPDNTTQVFDVEAAIANGDIVTVTSIPRSKSVIRTTSGTPTSILAAYQPGSIWPTLSPGENSFRVAVSGAPIDYTIQYTAKYGGL
jgi:Phage tail protein